MPAGSQGALSTQSSLQGWVILGHGEAAPATHPTVAQFLCRQDDRTALLPWDTTEGEETKMTSQTVLGQLLPRPPRAIQASNPNTPEKEPRSVWAVWLSERCVLGSGPSAWVARPLLPRPTREVSEWQQHPDSPGSFRISGSEAFHPKTTSVGKRPYGLATLTQLPRAPWCSSSEPVCFAREE